MKIKENKKRVKYPELSSELKKKEKIMEHEGDGDTNCNWCTYDNTERIG